MLEKIIKASAGLVLAAALWSAADAGEGKYEVDGDYRPRTVNKRYKVGAKSWKHDLIKNWKHFHVGDKRYTGRKENWFLLNGEHYQIIVTDDEDVLFGRLELNHNNKKKHVELLEATLVPKGGQIEVEKGSTKLIIYADGSYDKYKKELVRKIGKRPVYRYTPIVPEQKTTPIEKPVEHKVITKKTPPKKDLERKIEDTALSLDHIKGRWARVKKVEVYSADGKLVASDSGRSVALGKTKLKPGRYNIYFECYVQSGHRSSTKFRNKEPLTFDLPTGLHYRLSYEIKNGSIKSTPDFEKKDAHLMMYPSIKVKQLGNREQRLSDIKLEKAD